jgi:DICT domain-containing protein/nitrogen-specific signal transduction histidine kinase
MGMKNSNSLLQDLLQLLPQIKAQIYFKASLTAISHAMEDLVLSGTEQPLVIANFQEERFYRQETRRYQRLAEATDHIYILAAPETDFASAPAPYATIGLDPTDELTQEWHLVIVGQNYSACLICREYAAPVNAIALDSARQFQGFWTFDPKISRQAALSLFQRIERYRPDLSSQIQEAKQDYQLANFEGNVSLSKPVLKFDDRLFIDRLVTYLQAGQYKQVKAYRRIIAQERQERLVNQITAAIRQSLKPEDVLSATLREVGQMFGQCRCLLYRLPFEPIKYESSHPSLPSLLGKDWHLASHPLFEKLLQQQKIVAIADTSQDLGIQSDIDLQRELDLAQIRACLLVPVSYQQRYLAVLELHQSHPHFWSTVDRDLLAAIASQVGLALMQAEAYVNLEQLNHKLVAIEQAQTNLIAIVGHELRTPLSTIQICLESLMAEPDMPLQFQQVMVETALGDSERLRKLIQDFLLLSRLETNLNTWEMEPVDLADSITLALNNLRDTSRFRDLPTINVEMPPSLPLAIADGEALLQLLSKLLDNACKFTPPTGTVTVKIRDVNIPTLEDQTQTQEMLEVQIADTGCGIESRRLETIFERFYQEEGFLSRAVGGAGLGLAICRQLVRQLGGQIWATSKGKGCGSQFYFTLPVLT